MLSIIIIFSPMREPSRLFFFFQAEDGIRDLYVTGVQTCALPISPLKRISEGLAAIRSGTAERLEGAFPVEIAPLARETNALIDANREIVTRARTHVGNLAHALKTPISVMLNEATAHGSNPL